MAIEDYVQSGCFLRRMKINMPRFKHVRVVFLPPCEQNDIDELEAELQIQPDIKSEYPW